MFWIVYDVAAIIYSIVGAIFLASTVFSGFLFGVMLVVFIWLLLRDIERRRYRKWLKEVEASYHRVDGEWRSRR